MKRRCALVLLSAVLGAAGLTLPGHAFAKPVVLDYSGTLPAACGQLTQPITVHMTWDTDSGNNGGTNRWRGPASCTFTYGAQGQVTSWPDSVLYVDKDQINPGPNVHFDRVQFRSRAVCVLE